jgi:ribose transport system permease protein
VTAAADNLLHRFRRSGVPPIVASLVVLAILLVIYGSVSEGAFSKFTLQELATVTATLAILAVGQTVVVISGGFDFSSVAVLAFLNSFLVTQSDHFGGSYTLTAIVVILIGVAIGAVNGILVGFLRVQSIIATIATFFVLSGGALALLESPGGEVPASFSEALSGEWGPIPASAGILVIVGLIWLLLKNLRFGRYLYAVGSHSGAAFARGVPVRGTLVAAYAGAGFFYGVAALTYTAATASGDPRVNFALFVQMFAAVVIGGTVLGGGRGGAVGSIVGALCLILLESILFSLGFQSYYTPIIFGAVLLAVILPSAIGSDVMTFLRRFRRHPRQPAVTVGGEG